MSEVQVVSIAAHSHSFVLVGPLLLHMTFVCLAWKLACHGPSTHSSRAGEAEDFGRIIPHLCSLWIVCISLPVPQQHKSNTNKVHLLQICILWQRSAHPCELCGWSPFGSKTNQRNNQINAVSLAWMPKLAVWLISGRPKHKHLKTSQPLKICPSRMPFRPSSTNRPIYSWRIKIHAFPNSKRNNGLVCLLLFLILLPAGNNQWTERLKKRNLWCSVQENELTLHWLIKLFPVIFGFHLPVPFIGFLIFDGILYILKTTTKVSFQCGSH